MANALELDTHLYYCATKARFDELCAQEESPIKDNAFYFILDTKQLYKGTLLLLGSTSVEGEVEHATTSEIDTDVLAKIIYD